MARGIVLTVCRRRIPLLVVGFSLMLIAGCVTAPVQVMSNARQAVQAAARAGAPRSAPALYAEAERWLDNAEFFLKAGNYEKARQSAAKAAAAAREAAAVTRSTHPPAPASG